MSKVLVTEQYLSDIADAIREKGDTASSMTPSQMSTAIAGINDWNDGVNQYYRKTLKKALTGCFAGMTSIPTNMMRSFSGLTRVAIPDTVTLIGDNVFYDCANLRQTDLGNGITAIGTYVFHSCPNLRELTIPAGVTQIGAYSLCCGQSYANTKTTFTFLGTIPPTIQSTTFLTTNIEKIIVPVGYGNAYKSATNWSALASYIEEAQEESE